jgi:signal peptidase
MRARILRIAGGVVLSLVFAVILAAIAFLVVIPRAVHGAALTVLTGSMTPGIPVGSIVVDRPVDPGTLHVGDIATYQEAPGKAVYVTHRIVKIDASKSPTMFTFKGDANRGPDIKPVPATAIRGKVWLHVPYLGAIRDTLHTTGGIAGVAMVLLAGYAFMQGASGLRDRGRARTQAADADGKTIDVPIVIVAQLPIAAFEGLNAQSATWLLGATLIDTDDDTITIVLPECPERLEATLDLLQAFEPVALHLAEASPDHSLSSDWRIRKAVPAGV